MLFNSYIFVFIFLPIVLCIFYKIGPINHRLGIAWLTAASVFFYGWWNPNYLVLLFFSIIINFLFGIKIARTYNQSFRKFLFILSIVFNLILLAYYKYTDFIIFNFNNISTTEWALPHIILPLGISFYTFTQIAFLVDTYRGEVKEFNFLHYMLFVTYFPHLIAGPIIHHKEVMPQFNNKSIYAEKFNNVAIGLTVFIIGLSKKLLLADQIAPTVDSIFLTANQNNYISTYQSWIGALGYTLQLYFDFSGYSDMAIGLSKMLGIKLPLNFNSPYKALNIIDFWRRWHMTLSRFLRDYLYIPLGGNRKGTFRRHINLLITMFLGGLWHGAGWTFIIWGTLHGIYLIINHIWSNTIGQIIKNKINIYPIFVLLYKLVCQLITLLCVIIAWVFFRAPDTSTAISIIKSMFGRQNNVQFIQSLPYSTEIIYWLISLLLIVWMLPNTQQIVRQIGDFTPKKTNYINTIIHWKPNFTYLFICSLLFVICLLLINKESTFLYYQF
ncbi:MAG: MBOAT family protein [Alphaproteobacteria bacterium]|nr:MBOAT family protein [Alphaproteobacteria bacterium]